MGLEVISPGLLTTVQDAGRVGFAAQGCRQAGACDVYAMRLANLLCGNDEHAAVLEMTFRGGTFRFGEATAFALTGAVACMKLDGTAVPMRERVAVRTGQTLEVGTAQKGLRMYLAVGGGIAVPEVLSSRSTDLITQVGGFCGRALQAGDVLPLGDCTAVPESGAVKIPENLFSEVGRRRRFTSSGTVPVLRFVPGPQDDFFSPDALAALQRQIYTVGADSNRMGCRLQGQPLPGIASTDILSDAIVSGSVQITSAGLPIVMMADHQTTGGYAKIGTVISADVAVLAQCRPGERVAFSAVTSAEARESYLSEEQKLREIRRRVYETEAELVEQNRSKL